MALQLCGSVEAGYSDDTGGEQVLFAAPSGDPLFYRLVLFHEVITQQSPGKDVMLDVYSVQNGVKSSRVHGGFSTTNNVGFTGEVFEFWADGGTNVTVSVVEDSGVTASYRWLVKATPL